MASPNDSGTRKWQLVTAASLAIAIASAAMAAYALTREPGGKSELVLVDDGGEPRIVLDARSSPPRLAILDDKGRHEVVIAGSGAPSPEQSDAPVRIGMSDARAPYVELNGPGKSGSVIAGVRQGVPGVVVSGQAGDVRMWVLSEEGAQLFASALDRFAKITVGHSSDVSRLEMGRIPHTVGIIQNEEATEIEMTDGRGTKAVQIRADEQGGRVTLDEQRVIRSE